MRHKKGIRERLLFTRPLNWRTMHSAQLIFPSYPPLVGYMDGVDHLKHLK
jgi:hypothetical protein